MWSVKENFISNLSYLKAAVLCFLDTAVLWKILFSLHSDIRR